MAFSMTRWREFGEAVAKDGTSSLGMIAFSVLLEERSGSAHDSWVERSREISNWL